MMNIYKKLAKNSIIFSVGNFFSKFITILMLPFYTRVLSQEEFGQVDLISTTITLLIPFLTVNIVEAVVRFSLDRKNYSYGQVLSNSMVFILSGSIILICLYPLFAQINVLADFIITFYILFLIQATRTSVKQFARSVDQIKVYMFSDILYSLIFVFFNIIFLFYIDIGVLGYLLSMILGYGIDLIYLIIKTKAHRFVRVKYLDRASIKAMFIYCLPLMPNSVMWWITGISDRYIITYYSGLASAGIYAAANKFPSIITTIYSLFYKAWQISAIEEYDNSNKEKFYSNIFNVFFFMLIIIASLFIIFNKLIIGVFLSNEFFEVWRYTPFLVMGAIFSSFSGFLGTNYQAAKKTAGILYSSVAGAVLNLILNIILIPRFGIYGASIATMISFLFMWLIRIVDTRRFVKINYPKLRMITTFILLSLQVILLYINIDLWIYSIMNLLIFGLILVVGAKYIIYPTQLIYLKVFKK